MYTNEIINELKDCNYQMPIERVMDIVSNSPQVKGVTYNCMIFKYQMDLRDSSEPLCFLIKAQ